MPIVNTEVPVTSALNQQYLQQIAETYPFTKLEKVGVTDFQRPLWMLTIGNSIYIIATPSVSRIHIADIAHRMDRTLISSLCITRKPYVHSHIVATIIPSIIWNEF